MTPIDALSALTSPQISAPNIGFQPTAALPGVSGAPISEGFNLNPAQAGGQIIAPAVTDPLAQAAASLNVGAAGGPSTWGHMVQQMVMDVNAQQTTAAQKVSDVLQGGPTPVHEAMVASEEASLSFEFLGEMRNKIVDAYNQVMQMQV